MEVRHLHTKLVGICSDDTSDNKGKHSGLPALLRVDSPWLVAIHCMNHHIELTHMAAFVQSYVEEIMNILTAFHSTYERIPER